jgi:hypothetical protein
MERKAYRFGEVVLPGDSIEQGAFASSRATQNRNSDLLCGWNFAEFFGLALVGGKGCAARVVFI